jgi:nucleoside-diphosphate-sugar epimerase
VKPATLVVGTGYLGQRFIQNQDDEKTIGLARADFDLDFDGKLPTTLTTPYSVLYTVPPSSRFSADVRLERLLRELEPAPRRFVYISTTGVYGNRDGELVDENSSVNPESDRASRRVAAEDYLFSWGTSQDCEIVVLRVPGIYGPGRLGVDRLREGATVIRDEESGPGNRIHVDDLVNCCINALSSDAPPGIYNVGDGNHRSSTWFTREIARQAGLPEPRAISMAEAEKEYSPMRMSFIRESREVDTQKMCNVLGVTPVYANAEDGIAQSLLERSRERDQG